MFLCKLNLSLILVILCSFETRVNSDEEVPLTKFGSQTGPVIKFLYCYSCGYKRVYNEYQAILRKKYPEIQIIGDNYNPPGYNMILAKILSVTKLLFVVLIIFKINIFQFFGEPQPLWWQWFMDNNWYSSIMLFFVCNAMEGFLISSGAFEVYFNDVPVWSKLETGKIPVPEQLIQIIDNHMQMLFPEMGSTKINYYNI